MATPSANVVDLVDAEPNVTPEKRICAKCGDNVSPKRLNPITCSQCKSVFHGKDCCGVANSTWDQWSFSRVADWVCPRCKTGFHYDGSQPFGRPKVPKALNSSQPPLKSKVPKPTSQKTNPEKVSVSVNDKSNPSSKKTDSIAPIVVEPAAPVVSATSQSNAAVSETQQPLESLDSLNPFKPRNSLARDPISLPPVGILQENLDATQRILDEIDQEQEQDSHVATSTPVPKRYEFDDTNDNIEKAYVRLGNHLGLENLGPEEQTPGIRNLNKMIAYLIGAVMKLSGKLEGVSAKLEAAEAESKKLAAENESLRATNEILQKRVDDTEDRAENYRRAGEYRQRMADNYSRANNLVLHGSPVISAENPSQVEAATFGALAKVCDEMGVPIQSSDIDICHPLPSRGAKHKMIYRFLRRTKKNEILRAAKRIKLSAKKLNWGDDTRKVFVTEHISPDTARLLALAKSRLAASSDGPFQFVWAKQGRILAGNGGKGRTFEVRWQEDVDDLLYQYGDDRQHDHQEHSPRDSTSQQQ